MYVTNETAREIIAAGWHEGLCYGKAKVIPPGRTVWVVGPPLGRFGKNEIFSFLSGKISITSAKTNQRSSFQLIQGTVIHLKSTDLPDRGVSIHF